MLVVGGVVVVVVVVAVVVVVVEVVVALARTKLQSGDVTLCCASSKVLTTDAWHWNRTSWFVYSPMYRTDCREKQNPPSVEQNILVCV